MQEEKKTIQPSEGDTTLGKITEAEAEQNPQTTVDAKKKKPKRDKRTLLQLFLTFFKIGLFTFGGGYAMIPIIQRETVEKRGWITEDDIVEILAIAESTPGPISVNTATFVGYRTWGVLGAFLATLGLVLPSFGIIFGLFFVYETFNELAVVRYAFWGIRAGVLALIVKAFWTMLRKCPRKVANYLIALVAFVLVAFVGINAVFVLLGSAIVGLVYSIIATKAMRKKEGEK